MGKQDPLAVLPTAAKLLILGVIVAAFVAGPTYAQERRGRRTPGLVLETGARHAACDVVLFTPTGDELLAAGDDKVVRQWKVDKEGNIGEAGRILRWPIMRERRGGIHAMALSPDARHVAVTGYGVKDGLVMVLDRNSGEVVHVLDDKLSPAVNWAITWSPDGRFILFGSEYGDLFRWEPTAEAATLHRFAGKRDGKVNRVRLIAFVDDTHFLSVAQDGKVWKRDVHAPGRAPAAPIAAFEGREYQTLVAAAFSRASKRLAACQDYHPGRVLWLDLKEALAGGETRKPPTRYLEVPEDGETRRYAWSLAFDASGDRLAAGTRDTHKGGGTFARVTGGGVYVYSLAVPVPRYPIAKKGLDCGYAVDALAFRPGAGDQLASAGGPNHEVQTWAYQKATTPLSEVRSPGSCLWSVAVDAKGKYLAWREQFNTRPKHPNDRGAGDWRYFKLDRRTRHVLTRAPADFTPVKPLDALDGWRVRPTTNSHVWEVIETVQDGSGEEVVHELSGKTELYLEHLNGLPRCYTFLRATTTKPARLAIGHTWGVSVYELRPRKVQLARYLSGHEGEVMAVVASADGKLLYTASRDQTIGCWSLEDWPNQGELGARFRVDEGTVVVGRVAPGSPAWEMGLTDGDEILMVLSKDRFGPGAFLFDRYGVGPGKYRLGTAPEMRAFDTNALLDHLANPEPAREYVFVWRQGKDGPWKRGLTTLPQRPLWRFFPTRQEEGSQWVLWRWRDFYYDTMSPRPDTLVGWHVFDDRDLKVAPSFHRLGSFGSRRDGKGAVVEGFHDPERVWTFIDKTNHEPEKVLFPAIEPPRLELSREAPAPDKDNDLKLDVRITPETPDSPGQAITRVVLWVEDGRFEHPWTLPPKTAAVSEKVVVPRSRLHQGVNRIKVVAFNREGGRAEQTVEVRYDGGGKVKPTLRGLCVGIDDYGKARLSAVEVLRNLTCSVADATLVDQVLRQQDASPLFEACDIQQPLRNHDATARAILSRLRKIAREGKVKPNDWFVLFLSGHGVSGPKPGDFIFACADSNRADPGSLLRAKDLHDALRDIHCRKLVILDTCHSGQVATSPIRELNKDGVEFRIFSACKPNQQALEPTAKAVAQAKGALRQQGFFTQSLMAGLRYPDEAKGGRRKPITDRELADKVSDHLRFLVQYMRRLGEKNADQEPEFYPERKDMRGLELLSRP